MAGPVLLSRDVADEELLRHSEQLVLQPLRRSNRDGIADVPAIALVDGE